MNKELLRQVYLQKRQTLTHQQVAERSKEIAQILIREMDWSTISFLHLFQPIQKFNEAHTQLIVDELKAKYPHIQFVYSVSELNQNKMQHFVVNTNTEWTINKWGIKEPVNGQTIAAKRIDAVFLPLIVADKLGHRIGYGKGYYDRFLSEECRPDVLSIGISLCPLLDPINIFEEFDIKMRYCVNHRELYKC